MKRRQFIAGLGSTAAWPAVARAQQGDRMRRIGVLMNGAPDDPEAQTRNAAFLQGLQEWGWTIGRNVRIDTRWALGNTDRLRRYATELERLRRMSSRPPAPRAWRLRNLRPEPYQSCSPM